MSTIFGALGLNDNDRIFGGTIDQSVIYDVVAQEVLRYNFDLSQALSVFVEGDTTDAKWRYKLPGSGYMSRRGVHARGPSVKATGEWDVAFPLEDFDEALWSTDVSRAYMTAAGFERHLTTIFNRHTNMVRFEMLKPILNNTQRTFVDPQKGSLLIEPLANGDAVVYPPVLGSTTEATQDNYLESGYAASAISDVNNPYETLRDQIEQNFGTSTGGENLVVFINNAQRTKTEELTEFDTVPDRFIRVGDDTDVPEGLPNVPGRILGRVSGCWAVEWRFIPANYMVIEHLEQPPPILRRVDPGDTGLPSELTMISEDATYPFEAAEWRHRFGFGVGNRLNGAVMELGTGGTYTIPTDFA